MLDLPIALMLFAAPVAAGPPTAPAEVPAEDRTASSLSSTEPCENRQQRDGDIVICAERVTGYRIDPDIAEAKRLRRSGGRPRSPESYKQEDCAIVGPMGCRGGALINLPGAALTAIELARRVASGQEVASLFRTTPEPTEYQIYVALKRDRAAREEAEADLARARAAKTAADARGKPSQATETAPQPANEPR